jgi:hypothetical protein
MIYEHNYEKANNILEHFVSFMNTARCMDDEDKRKQFIIEIMDGFIREQLPVLQWLVEELKDAERKERETGAAGTGGRICG